MSQVTAFSCARRAYQPHETRWRSGRGRISGWLWHNCKNTKKYLVFIPNIDYKVLLGLNLNK